MNPDCRDESLLIVIRNNHCILHSDSGMLHEERVRHAEQNIAILYANTIHGSNNNLIYCGAWDHYSVVAGSDYVLDERRSHCS